ncbi:hypothetical protein CNMCM5623_001865 [Aspergillus felis]|uniref:Uncharacterized protein n=1 Tax=Aspergillus felis TaxID=1287682 RepID=A0A8H6QBG5_9EURO|nr:hypothetical protein CNMCM5623_001865 [Aspergillus felis]
MASSPEVWLTFDATIFAVALCGCVLLLAVMRSPVLKEIVRHRHRSAWPSRPSATNSGSSKLAYGHPPASKPPSVASSSTGYAGAIFNSEFSGQEPIASGLAGSGFGPKLITGSIKDPKACLGILLLLAPTLALRALPSSGPPASCRHSTSSPATGGRSSSPAPTRGRQPFKPPFNRYAGASASGSQPRADSARHRGASSLPAPKKRAGAQEAG